MENMTNEQIVRDLAKVSHLTGLMEREEILLHRGFASLHPCLFSSAPNGAVANAQ